MKPMDLHDFEKKIRSLGYRIGTVTKHHAILRPDDEALIVFAIAHKKGGKRYVKGTYVKRILSAIEQDQQQRRNKR